MSALASRANLSGLSKADALTALRDLAKDAREGNTAELFRLLRGSREAAFGIAIQMPELGDIVGTHGIRLSDAVRESGLRNISMFIAWVKANTVPVNMPALWQAIIYDEESAMKTVMQARPFRLLARDPEDMANALDMARNAWLEGTIASPGVAGRVYIKAMQLRVSVQSEFPGWPFR